MQRNGNIVSYTTEELAEMRARGESKTDWARVDATTQEELEAAIASDPDEADIEWDPDSVMAGFPASPKSKMPISIRLDPDVLDFFRREGRGYQTKINAVLRQYMEAMRQK